MYLRVTWQEVLPDFSCDVPALQDRSQVLGPEDGFELPLPLLSVIGHHDQTEDAQEDDDGGE